MREFDPDSDFQKHRDMVDGVHYTQDGYAFTTGFKCLGKVTGTKKPATTKEQTPAQKSAKERASDKLKGFAKPDMPDEMQSALEENKAAAIAEEGAE